MALTRHSPRLTFRQLHPIIRTASVASIRD